MAAKLCRDQTTTLQYHVECRNAKKIHKTLNCFCGSISNPAAFTKLMFKIIEASPYTNLHNKIDSLLKERARAHACSLVCGSSFPFDVRLIIQCIVIQISFVLVLRCEIVC